MLFFVLFFNDQVKRKTRHSVLLGHVCRQGEFESGGVLFCPKGLE